MKRILIYPIIAAFVVCTSANAQETTKPGNSSQPLALEVHNPVSIQDLCSLYEVNKKWAYTAAGWTIACPTLGHAYAGDWVRGLYFLGAKVAIAGATYGIYKQMEYQDLANKQSALNSALVIGGLLWGISTIWEAYDAVQVAEEYNQKLRENLKINVEPNQGGMKITVKYKF